MMMMMMTTRYNRNTVLSDKDELGADVHRCLVSDVTLTAVHVEPVKHAEQSETIFFRRRQRNYVFTKVIGTDGRQRVVSVKQIILVFDHHVGAHLSCIHTTRLISSKYYPLEAVHRSTSNHVVKHSRSRTKTRTCGQRTRITTRKLVLEDKDFPRGPHHWI